MPDYKVYQGSCLEVLPKIKAKVDLTFLDPPFNQNKDYKYHNDNLSDKEYWDMMFEVSSNVYNITSNGGSIYFMQREKNTEMECALWTGVKSDKNANRFKPGKKGQIYAIQP